MKGIVILQYFENENLLSEFSENNLLVDGAGETICDMLTISPSLSAIPSASAILDASNYTIQAVSFGKDSDGYRTHAHGLYFNLLLPLTPTGVRVASYESASLSSYHGSAMPFIFSSAGFALAPYKLLPKYPDPIDTRLETKNTAVFPGLASFIVGNDVGQNLNSLQSLDEIGGLEPFGTGVSPGTYPPNIGIAWRILSSPSNIDSVIVSGVYRGTFNKVGSMDYSGYVTMMSSSVVQGLQFGGSAVTNISGLSIFALSNFSSTGRVGYHVTLSGGDAGLAALYGGIYHIGLWTLDMKSLLESGQTPPYSFNRYINPRKYRLFAKKTFNQDITYITDDTSIVPAISGAFDFQNKAININWTLIF